MIHNRRYSIKKSSSLGHLTENIRNMLEEQGVGTQPLRWYISQVSGDALLLETTTFEGELSSGFHSVVDQHYPGKCAVLNIVPTGVGCDIGGYAGDAAPVTNLLAAAVDYLITNPNAVNASNFIDLGPRVIYTEGSSIDLFCQGLANLYLPYSNRVGLVIEKSTPDELEIIFNILNAVRAIYGINIKDYVITDQPIRGRSQQNETGAFVGTIDHPEVLFSACEELIAKGVNAIAVTSNIQDLPADQYARHFAGSYPNPVGGVEAIISYLITKRYQIPAAHAPMMNLKQIDLVEKIVDARGAGEFASISGLACVLIGLQKAPQIKAKPDNRIAEIININNLLAVVAPMGCMGGVPVLYCQQFGVPVIAVQENRTILDVTPEKLGLPHVIEVRTYAEAAGILLALKNGISLESISRPLQTLRPVIPDESLIPMEREVMDYEEQLVG